MNLGKGLGVAGTLFTCVMALLAAPSVASAFTVYVTNYSDDTVGAIDTAFDEPFGQDISTGIVAGPWYPEVSPDGSQLWVSGLKSGSIGIFGTADNRPLAQPRVAGPAGVQFSPDGSRAYVASYGDPGNIAVLSTSTFNELTPRIPVGEDPRKLAISPDGSRLYVPNAQDDDVTVIDTATNQRVGADIPVGNGPTTVAFRPDGSRAYVTNNIGDTLSVINTANRAVIAPAIPVNYGPRDIEVTAGGASAYVGTAARTVDIINLASNARVGQIEISGGGVAEIELTPDGRRLYAVYLNAEAGFSGMQVIDTASNSVLDNSVDTDFRGLSTSANGVAIGPENCIEHAKVAHRVALARIAEKSKRKRFAGRKKANKRLTAALASCRNSKAKGKTKKKKRKGKRRK